VKTYSRDDSTIQRDQKHTQTQPHDQNRQPKRPRIDIPILIHSLLDNNRTLSATHLSGTRSHVGPLPPLAHLLLLLRKQRRLREIPTANPALRPRVVPLMPITRPLPYTPPARAQALTRQTHPALPLRNPPPTPIPIPTPIPLHTPSLSPQPTPIPRLILLGIPRDGEPPLRRDALLLERRGQRAEPARAGGARAEGAQVGVARVQGAERRVRGQVADRGRGEIERLGEEGLEGGLGLGGREGRGVGVVIGVQVGREVRVRVRIRGGVDGGGRCRWYGRWLRCG
jgi:hypothetical protein